MTFSQMSRLYRRKEQVYAMPCGRNVHFFSIDGNFASYAFSWIPVIYMLHITHITLSSMEKPGKTCINRLTEIKKVHTSYTVNSRRSHHTRQYCTVNVLQTPDVVYPSNTPAPFFFSFFFLAHSNATLLIQWMLLFSSGEFVATYQWLLSVYCVIWASHCKLGPTVMQKHPLPD